MNPEIPSVTEPMLEPDIDPDILTSFEALPTEDDLPCDDGEPMETPRHREQMNVLIDSLKTSWPGSAQCYIGGNMFVHYDPQDRKRFRGPDFFLVLDVEERERKSWVVWREGMRFPDLIVELLSDSTRAIDYGEKKTLYERIFHTAEYYLYDPYSQEFVGYHIRGGRYETVPIDEQGRVYSPQTGLYLTVRDGWLRWMTPTGEVLPTPIELANQERQRAESAEQLLEKYRQQFGNLE